MNKRKRVVLGFVAVLVLAKLAITWLNRDSVWLNAENLCKGVPAAKAPPFDTSRQGIHKLAEPPPPRGEWSGWDTDEAPSRWYAQRLSEMELALCFASESVVVDTCRGYSTAGGWQSASDVILAKRRWTIKLLEARTGRVVDTLRVESPAGCPREAAESLNFLLLEVYGPAASDTLWNWVSRFVDLGSPGQRDRRACDHGEIGACDRPRSITPGARP